MKQIIIWIVVIALVIWGAVSLAGNKNPGAEGEQRVAGTNEPVKIGVVGPLTGDIASMGIPMTKAMELAVKEANEQGGINGRQIQLIIEDGNCNTKRASDAGAKLISVDKVTAILGGFCSGESSAFGPNAMQNKVVMISPISSAPKLSSLGKYFFRDYPSDNFQGKFAAEYAYNTIGARKVAVVYSTTDWGLGIKEVFVENFKKLGGEIILDEGVAQDARDYKTVLGKVRTSGADLLYAPLFTEGSIVMLKQIKDLGIKIKILGGDTWSDTKIHAAVDPSLAPMFLEVKTDAPQAFVDKFMAAYPNEKVGAGVPQSYDAVNLLVAALRKVGTNDPDALADAVRATKLDGVSGHIEFDQNGDIANAEYIVKKMLGNGKVEEVK